MSVLACWLTKYLLLAVTSDRADDCVFLSTEAIERAFGILLRLSRLVLCLALSVLLFPGLLPGLGASEVTDRLDNGTLQRVVLAGGLATSSRVRIMTQFSRRRMAYLGSPLLLLVLLSYEPDIVIDRCDRRGWEVSLEG